MFQVWRDNGETKIWHLNTGSCAVHIVQLTAVSNSKFQRRIGVSADIGIKSMKQIFLDSTLSNEEAIRKWRPKVLSWGEKIGILEVPLSFTNPFLVILYF